MPPHPRGDPLRRAAYAARAMGGVLVLFGLCGVVPTMTLGGVVRMTWAVALVPLLSLGSGVAFIVLSVFLGRGDRWAITASMVLACVSGALAVAGLALNAVYGMPGGVAFLALMLVLAAAAELAFYLMRASRALKLQPVDGVRGFEPLPLPSLPALPARPEPRPADQVAPTDPGDPSHAPPAAR